MYLTRKGRNKQGLRKKKPSKQSFPNKFLVMSLDKVKMFDSRINIIENNL